jgi:hypothetical protein
MLGCNPANARDSAAVNVFWMVVEMHSGEDMNVPGTFSGNVYVAESAHTGYRTV